MTLAPNRCGIDISLTFNEEYCTIDDKMVSQSGELAMNHEQAVRLGNYIRRRRKQRRLSSDDVATSASVDAAQVLRIERGQVLTPAATTLGAIAASLKIPVNDLLVLAGYPTSRSLPSIEPYLRAKYPMMPDEDRDHICAVVNNSYPAQRPQPVS